MSKIKYSPIVFLLLFLLSTKNAHAYLDPGTGSFVLQFLVAGVLGGVLTVKTFWKNITSFFGPKDSKKTTKKPAKKK